MGCDGNKKIPLNQLPDISIHAPVWGATYLCQGFFKTCSYFNPRTRMGCDKGEEITFFIGDKFQSTHPYGVRLPFQFEKVLDKLFQSTHPYGVRPDVPATGVKSYGISIHAPVWGATSINSPLLYYFHISIHAPVWGATRGQEVRKKRTLISIHAPVWGATLII